MSQYSYMEFGVRVAVALTVAFTLYGALCLLCRHPALGGAARIVRHTVHVLFILWVVSFVVVEGLILGGAHSDPEESADCVLVLGAGLNGTYPSYALMARLNKAISYLRQYPDAPVVVSGGQGEGESITEAEAMYRYLTRYGIDAERIRQEDQAVNTDENIKFSIPLMPDGTTSVAVVSNEFHLFRARALLRRSGMTPLALSADTPLWYLKLIYHIREYFSVVYLWHTGAAL
jgi:uncharacterized SAM-binding protein YcdF (DUF218 family)